MYAQCCPLVYSDAYPARRPGIAANKPSKCILRLCPRRRAGCSDKTAPWLLRWTWRRTIGVVDTCALWSCRSSSREDYAGCLHSRTSCHGTGRRVIHRASAAVVVPKQRPVKLHRPRYSRQWSSANGNVQHPRRHSRHPQARDRNVAFSRARQQGEDEWCKRLQPINAPTHRHLTGSACPHGLGGSLPLFSRGRTKLPGQALSCLQCAVVPWLVFSCSRILSRTSSLARLCHRGLIFSPLRPRPLSASATCSTKQF